jgi:Protein of unknown function (DUF3619)
MNNHMNTNEIRQLLNRSAGQLSPDTLASLRKAREQAMHRHDPDAHARWMWVGNWRHSPAAWVATLVITLSLVGGGVYYWEAHDNSDVDLAILTDDLPANLYVN